MADATRSLESCCVHVWQRVDGDVHAHDAVTAKLKQLGCKVAARLNKDITHVIFQRKFNSTAAERKTEDEDLRKIYSRLPKDPPAFVVNPLWLTLSETAGAPVKERQYIVRRPADPIFLTSPNKSGELCVSLWDASAWLVPVFQGPLPTNAILTGPAGPRRKRKSCAARPREQVELPDIDDALFSSSQQIRELNEHGGSFSDGEVRKASVAPVLSDVEEDEEKLPRSKPCGPAPSSKPPAGTCRPQSEQRAGAAQRNLAGAKRGTLQTTLKFAVIPKKPRLSLAEGGGPSSAAQAVPARQANPQQPAADRKVAEQPAWDKDGADNRGPQKAADLPPDTKLQKPPPAVPPVPQSAWSPAPPPLPLTQQQHQQQAERTGVPEPTNTAQQRATAGARYSALRCAVVPAGGADTRRLAGSGLPDAVGRGSLGHAAPAAPLAPLPPPAAATNPRPDLSLPTRLQAPQKPVEGGSAGDVVGTVAATATAELPPAASHVGKAEDGNAGQVPPHVGPDAAAAPAPAASAVAPHAVTRGSAHRRSRSISGTPLGPALIKSMGRLTPKATPQGLTPGCLVLPKLKSQGGATPAAAAAGTPAAPSTGPNTASSAHKAAEAEPAGQAGPAAEAQPAAAAAYPYQSPELQRKSMPAPASGQGPVGAAGQQAVAASGVPGGQPVATASVRRSARARGLLPPTPPPMGNVPVAPPSLPVQLQEAQAGQGDAPKGAAELGEVAGAAAAPSLDLGSGPAGCAAAKTPTLHVAVAASTHSRATRADDDARLVVCGEVNGVREGCADTGRRSQRRASSSQARMPLPLSPVVHASVSGRAQGPEHAPASAPWLAGAVQAHVANAAAAAVVAPAEAARTAAPAVAGLTPGSVLRRSARLGGLSPLVSGLLKPQLGDRDASEKGQAPAVQPAGNGQQQDQQSPGAAWAGFQPVLQPRLQGPPPLQLQKALSRELVGLALQGAAWAAPPEEQPAAVGGCTPATGRMTRRRQRGSACEESAGVSPQQQQQQPAAASMLRPPAQCGEAEQKLPPDLVVALPSPALCTRSRARGAAGTPRLLQDGSATQQPQPCEETTGPLPPHPASRRTPARAGDPSAQVPPQPQPRPPRDEGGDSDALRLADGVARVAAQAATVVAPPSTRGRPGSVTRSRRRAIESELECAAQAPPSPAARGVRARATAALLEAAAPPANATQSPGGTGRSGPADKAAPTVVAPPGRPPRPTPAARQGTCSAAGPKDRTQSIQAATIGPASIALAEGASGTVCQEPHKPTDATPRAATARGAAAAAGVRAGAPRPPRSSSRKRPLDAQSAALATVDSTDGAAAATPVSGATGVPLTVAPSAAGGGDGRTEGDAGSPSATAAAATTKPVEPKAASRLQARPPPRSRLRLRKQDGDPISLTGDPGVGAATDAVGAQEGAVAGASAQAVPTQGPTKRRKTLPTATPQAAKDGGKEPGRSEPHAAAAAGAAAAQDAQGRTGGASEPAAAAQSGSNQAQPPAGGDGRALPKGAPATAARSGAVDGRKVAPQRPSIGSAAPTKPGGLQCMLSRSVGLAGATPSVGKGAPRPTSMCLGSGASRLNRLASGVGAEVAGLGALEPSLAGAAEAPAAPALGQYPRGKEHPMRAGYRYLASTRVGKEMEATLEKAIKQLGNARLCTPGYEDGHITHLVVGDAETRTVKVLLGIANGALFVKPSWVESSVAAGVWVPEEEHLLQSAFAATASKVRAQLQAQQRGAGASTGAPADAAEVQQAGAVQAKPLAQRLVVVRCAQCNGPGLGELQKRKADLEKLALAPGGRVVPVRSAALLIVVGGSASQTEKRQMQVATEEWLLRLAETHVWQEP
ncbi:hypothetical protein PLESTB_000031100 [Pleodorina starrii]|uniref:BRCT domain-containing protein n=1 Tax=Pleodorina starrii TaxID=330485 RepID=A0A9W6B916_9CHLO|nr:hypothetical protein PLESTB_000031100 [Pleodorina starrii]